MKQRCPRQHRMGETCGAKLADPDNIQFIDDTCRICKEIRIKERRLQKECDNITRWRREGDRFRASIEKAERESRQLEEAIAELQDKRAVVKFKLKDGARLPTMSR